MVDVDLVERRCMYVQFDEIPKSLFPWVTLLSLLEDREVID